MENKQIVVKTRYFVWHYSLEDDLGDSLQQGIQEYIKRYQINPFYVLVPEGSNLLPPMDDFVIEPNETVPPFRFYFAIEEVES